jgi:hypothetical protein
MSRAVDTTPPHRGVGARPQPVDEAIDGLARMVDEAVRLLGQAGEVDAACRLAARAWWLADARAPLAARRLSATLHHLTGVYEKGRPA